MGKKKQKTVDELLQEITVEGEIATVSVSMAVTLNMGNYESMKYQLGVSLPVAGDDIETARLLANQYVEEKMDERVQEIKDEY